MLLYVYTKFINLSNQQVCVGHFTFDISANVVILNQSRPSNQSDNSERTVDRFYTSNSLAENDHEESEMD